MLLWTIAVHQPVEIMATDILGPFLESERGNAYILYLLLQIFLLERWKYLPFLTKRPVQFLMCLWMKYSCAMSSPSSYIPIKDYSLNHVFLEVCKWMGTQKSRTTPYHPQCDGMVEWFNRTLLSMLATHCKDKPWNWENHIHKVCFAYNISIHASTGYTPFYLMYGLQTTLMSSMALLSHMRQTHKLSMWPNLRKPSIYAQ